MNDKNDLPNTSIFRKKELREQHARCKKGQGK